MRAIINSEEVISKIRGKWHEININKLKVLAMVSFHPAYLLRQPDQKKFSWIDLKMIREKLKNLNLKNLKKYKIIAGVDEVGRGCLAGPVVSAAVILKKGCPNKKLKRLKKNSLLNKE